MRTFFNVWVISTVLLYYFGPIDWPGSSEPVVAVFIGACVLSFNLGYLSLVNPEAWRYSDYDVLGVLKKRSTGIGIMLAYSALSLIYLQLVTGQSLISALAVGFDFTNVYIEYQRFVEGGVNIGLAGWLVSLLKAVIFPVALVLVCKYYGRDWLILLLFFVPMVVFSLARGTDKETFDLVLILGVVAFYHGFSTKSKLFLVMAVPVVLFLFMIRKYGRFGETVSFVTEISPLIEFGYLMAINYVTQGYEGLNMAFQLDIDFSYGLGHLPPIRSMTCGILGIGCELGSLADKLTANGWDMSTKWATAYVALANDLFWIFIPAYTFFLGWSLRLAEADWTSRKNPAALANIVLIGVFTLYSSANMQLAISLDWALATVFLLYGKALTVRTRRHRESPRVL